MVKQQDFYFKEPSFTLDAWSEHIVHIYGATGSSPAAANHKPSENTVFGRFVVGLSNSSMRVCNGKGRAITGLFRLFLFHAPRPDRQVIPIRKKTGRDCFSTLPVKMRLTDLKRDPSLLPWDIRGDAPHLHLRNRGKNHHRSRLPRTLSSPDQTARRLLRDGSNMCPRL